MGCGDRYRGRIATSSGLTPADPCGWICTASDFAEWRDEADRWHSAVAEAWAILQKAREAKGLEIAPEGDLLTAEYQRYEEQFGKLPRYLLTAIIETLEIRLTTREWIALVVSNALLAVCILEQIEDETESLGAEVRKLPGGPVKPSAEGDGGWLWAAFFGGAALSGLLAWRISSLRKRRR